MERTNKLLIILVFGSLITVLGALGTIAYVTKQFLDKNLVATSANSHLIQTVTNSHPYNDCIKLVIDQANKESIKFDHEKAKSLCFDLLNKSDGQMINNIESNK